MIEVVYIGECVKIYVLIKFKLLKWSEVMYDDKILNIGDLFNWRFI